MKTKAKMSLDSNCDDFHPNFEKLDKDFEIYTKKLFRNGFLISVLLLFVLFVILFVRVLTFELETQNNHIKLNSTIINERFNQVDDYLNLIKRSYTDYLRSNQKKSSIFIDSYKDKSNRYVHNSLYSGTYISLYQPINAFQDEVNALEYINHILQGYQFEFLLWTYFYSKNKFVYVYPYLPDPNAYGFSEKSYEGNILENTMKTDGFYISPVYRDAATSKIIFSIAIPVYQDQKYQGTFATDVDLYKIFNEIQLAYKDTSGLSLLLVNKYNQYFSFDKVNSNFLTNYKEISKKNFQFSFSDMRIVTSYKLMWDNYIVCSFPIKNIFLKSILNPSLLYFIFATIMFYLFNMIMYFRFMRPLQNLIIGILRYLTTKKFTFQSEPKKLKKFGYKKDLINEIQSTFIFLVKQFSVKEKIDNDIRISQDLMQYFIHNEFSCESYAYLIKPAFHFSGDYIRIFDIKKSPTDEHTVVSQIFFIADVSGKGIGAIFIVNQLNLFFDIYSDQIWDLKSFEDILNKFNQYFCEKNKNCDFIAFRALYIDKEKKEIASIDAGLPPFFAISNDKSILKIEQKDNKTPMGIDAYEQYMFIPLDIFPFCQTVILCTDGILEQTNEQGELFEEKFVSFLKHTNQDTKNKKHDIKSIWNYFFLFIKKPENQQDDFTLLMADLRG